jgi:hypothetical protein
MRLRRECSPFEHVLDEDINQQRQLRVTGSFEITNRDLKEKVSMSKQETTDTQTLITQEQRRLRMLESFKVTHRKLTDVPCIPEQIAMESPHVDHRERLSRRHLTDYKRAWRDGMAATRLFLRGSLPRDLRSVLGIAQVSSAIGTALDDLESSMISESRFLSDLGRWRQLLPSDAHATFDYYADIMWDERPSSDLLENEPHDAETLAYFQNLLVEMLGYFPSATPDGAQTLDGHPMEIPPQHELTQYGLSVMNLGEVVLYSTGAIFALLTTFLSRKF